MSSIFNLPTRFRILALVIDIQLVGVNPNSNDVDLITQSNSLSAGSKLADLKWLFVRVDGSTAVLSFQIFHAWQCPMGVTVKLIGYLALSDSGLARSPSKSLAKGSASLSSIKSPQITELQSSLSSIQVPNAYTNGGSRKAVTNVWD